MNQPWTGSDKVAWANDLGRSRGLASIGTRPTLKPVGETPATQRGSERICLPSRRGKASCWLRVKAHDLRKWRDWLTKELAAATVNRTANGLEAALNLVADH